MREIFVILTCKFLTLTSRPLDIRGELDVSQNIPRKGLDYLNIKDNPKLKKVLVLKRAKAKAPKDLNSRILHDFSQYDFAGTIHN